MNGLLTNHQRQALWNFLAAACMATLAGGEENRLFVALLVLSSLWWLWRCAANLRLSKTCPGQIVHWAEFFGSRFCVIFTVAYFLLAVLGEWL